MGKLERAKEPGEMLKGELLDEVKRLDARVFRLEAEKERLAESFEALRQSRAKQLGELEAKHNLQIEYMKGQMNGWAEALRLWADVMKGGR